MANQNNYFTMMIKKYNREDFVSMLSPQDIQKSAKEKIIREMAKGRIDYSIYGRYFEDNKFLDNIIIAVQDEYTNTNTIVNALRFYDMNFPGDMNVIANINRLSALLNIYGTVCVKLQETKINGNSGCLAEIPYILGPQSKYI